MSAQTRSQKQAQEAYARVAARANLDGEYVAFAKKFPALVHSCGLAQAIAFALAKKKAPYVNDLAAVLRAGGHRELDSAQALDQKARSNNLSDYLRLSRDAIDAASWLKRYVEAAIEEAG
jgi:CRISPR-associated protein Cmr5